MRRPPVRRRPACAALLATCLGTAAARADDRAICAEAYVAAQVRRSDHKLLAARDALRTCARQECANVMRGQMLKDCTAWLTEVDETIPSVVLSERTAAGVALSDVTVSIDGAIVATRLDGRAVDVDPGSHLVSFQAPGLPPVTVTALVLEGAKDQRVEALLPGKEPAGGREPSTVAAASPSVLRPGAAPGAREPAGASTPRWPDRVLTYTAFGVGAAGLAVGAIFGVLALSTKTSLDHECDGVHACTSPSAPADIDALHVRSWISNVAFGVGALGVAGGLGLVLFAPRRPSSAAAASTSTPSPATSPVVLTAWLHPGAAGVAGTFP